MGIFPTEHKILLNETLRGFFCNAKLIGEEYDPEYLLSYLNQFMNIFVNNQLVFFLNGQRMIDTFIIQSSNLLDSVIVDNEINISDMPEVQLVALLLEHDEVF